jgi:succinoglycan biosynthesis protein ExoL
MTQELSRTMPKWRIDGVKWCFVMPVIGQPRFWKRIEKLPIENEEVCACSFERAYFQSRGCYPIQARTLGVLGRGSISNLWTLFTSIFKLRRYINSAELVYCFSSLQLLLILIAGVGKRKGLTLVCEIADIEPRLYGGGLKGAILRSIESKVLRSADHIVCTASGFMTQFYEPRLKVTTPWTVVENKLPADLLEEGQRCNPHADRVGGPIRIGWFGLIRCEVTLQMLLALKRMTSERFELVVRGTYHRIDQKLIDELEAVTVNCPKGFHWPGDLPSIYGSVDLVVAAFPWQEEPARSWQLARTNRFYESCFFGKPMIVRSYSSDARVVQHHNIGLSVDLSDVNVAARKLSNITWEQISAWRSNLKELNPETYTDFGEHEKLRTKLSCLLRSKWVQS